MGGSDRDRVRAVEAWFAQAARDLPWRHGRTGYTGLVSEAMLQQTQVDRVIDRYQAFMVRFPTVESLAAASDEDVLAMWQGLGYYRRARNLRAAAVVVMKDHGGEVPSDPVALQRLPGVGRYTAGSIASIVFGIRTPIVDGNVQRVIARWDEDDAQPTDREAVRRTWSRAESLVDLADSPGVLNEGLMELGATVCTPRRAQCDACPVARWCATRRSGRQDEIPPPKTPAKKQALHLHTVIIERAGRVLLERRGDDGLWAGMWQTPTVESSQALTGEEFVERLSIRVESLESVHQFAYATTHRDITFHVYRGTTRVRRGEWRDVEALGELAMSNAMRRVLTTSSEHPHTSRR